MKDYNVFFIDGTYISIMAQGWLEEAGVVMFFTTPKDEAFDVIAEFKLDNIAGFREVI